MTGTIPVEIAEMDMHRCTLTYGVAPCTATGGAGAECYNTFPTCQDQVNYTQGIKTFYFCGRGTPQPMDVAICRPYVLRVKFAPTHIDPKVSNLAKRAAVSVTMADEPGHDGEQDPYVGNRASAAGGTFWTRFIARNRNYFGRFVRIKRGSVVIGGGGYYEAGYIADGYISGPDVYYSIGASLLTAELYIIDEIRGPTRDGTVEIILKDPLKLTDRATVPIPTSGKLASGISAGQTTIPLVSGEGAQYDQYGFPCVVKIGEEAIKIQSRSTDTLNVAASGRGYAGTTAATHNTSDVVKLGRSWESAAAATVLENLLNDAGIADTYIDLVQIASEDSTWLNTKYQITAYVFEPEEVSKLLGELLYDFNAMLWWENAEQKIKFKVDMPEVNASAPLLTDDESFILNSMEVQRLEPERITRAIHDYALTTPVANRNEGKNYLRTAANKDADAESAREYGDVRPKVTRSRFLSTANDTAAVALVARLVGRLRDAPTLYKFKLDPKDRSIRTGDLVDIKTADRVDIHGQAETVRARVVKMVDTGPEVEIEARSTVFARRYAFIAPNGQPNYPSATQAQRSYAYIVGPSAKFSDNTGPYLIV